MFELVYALIESVCVGLNHSGTALASETSVAPSVLGKIQIDDRNLLASNVLPNVELAPCEDRMHSDVMPPSAQLKKHSNIKTRGVL